MKFINITEFVRGKFPKILEKTKEEIYILKNGKPIAVIVPHSLWESKKYEKIRDS